MREIKFRAWDEQTKKMWHSDGTPLPMKIIFTAVCIFCQGKGGYDPSADHLMEFTGLHDKNGKEIYEGDIVAVKYSINRGQYSTYHDTQLIIKWNERKSGFYPFISWNDIYETEVIGNVFENKELLNDNKKTKKD